MINHSELPLIDESVITADATTYGLLPGEGDSDKCLFVQGDLTDFVGEALDDHTLLCPLTAANVAVLRGRLPWLRPVPLGLQTSAGFGDRLGIATPGHIQATHGTGVAPIFAQQSARENTRTGRTPQQVMDDAMWGVFQLGWKESWGADADHLKEVTQIAAFVQAGYTFFTIDPGDHVDDAAETDDLAALRAKTAALDWDTLQTSQAETQQRYQRAFTLDGFTLEFDEEKLLRAVVKYGAAVAHTLKMAHQLRAESGAALFEMEMSVDETGTTTSLHEHFYIAAELKRLEIPFVSLAPRFVGSFEKGVDYIGDLNALEENIAGHAAIIRYFDSSYKLSLHTGSDKFGVYPIAMQHTDGLVHLKTAGTSYLEALRLMAVVDSGLFRRVLDFAREHYETDRKTYHVSASLDRVPVSSDLTDSALPDLLNQFDVRQVLHVTFGTILDHFGTELHSLLRTHETQYHAYIKTHFVRHLEAFKR